MTSSPAKRPAGHTPPGPVTRMQDITTVFSPRDRTSHKGTFGTVAVLGGGEGMAGAALLAARAALHLGAGKVLVGFLQQPAPMGCDIMQPELMCRDARGLLDNDPGVTAWVAGCGAGQTPYTVDILSQLLARPRDAALVLDADALNLLAAQRLILPVALPALTSDTPSDALTTTGSPALSPNVDRTHPVVLTPHPAEAARLLNTTAAEIQADRSGAAKQLARQFGAWVVLKGADTVVSDPDGEWRVNTTGNPGLATAGTGDVLAGMIGSLLAQSLPVRQAVLGGVWLHGAAADACVAAGRGPIGLTAGELALAARHLRNHPPEID